MNVLGVDLSLTATGLALPDGSTKILRSRLTGAERLREYRSLLAAELNLLVHRWPLDLVVVEDLPFGHNKSAGPLGMLHGVIRVKLLDEGLRTVLVTPATLKKFACGAGNANKEAVFAAAIRRLGYEGISHDEADALWLRAIGMHLLGDPVVDVPQTHLDALAKVAWSQGAVAS